MNEELRAKDVYRSFPPRKIVGHALVAKVGSRAWKAPSFGPGRSLFGRCGLPDPWDPEVEQVDVGLGDVGLKDDRRQPAPHATPPPPPGSAAPKLPNVPAAKPSASPEAAKGRPAPQIGATRKVEAGELKPKTESVTTRPKAPPKREQPPSAFGGGPVHHAVAKLPVRPNIASVEPPAPVPAAPPPMSLGTGLGAPRAPPPAAAVRPAAPMVGRAIETAVTPAASRPAESAAPNHEKPPAAKPPPSPVNRRPPSAGGGGLDDIFGMGGGENTRIKLSRTPAEGEPPRARKLTVSSAEELAQQGVDRRPPPPKPPPAAPGVAPAAKPSSARSDDDLPDE